MIPMKNVEETDPSCERQADDSDFIWPSVYNDSMYKETLTITVSRIYFWFMFFKLFVHA